MEQRDSFAVYNGKLYAHAPKIYKEPVHNELSLLKASDKDILPESWTETASFVVDWEVREVEIRIFGKNYIPDVEDDFSDTKEGLSIASHGSNENDTSSFISDW